MGNTRIEIDEIKKLTNNFKLTKKEMNRFTKLLRERLPKSILTMLQKITSKDSGETARSWKIQDIENGFKITNNRGAILEFLIRGVSPHVIEAKDKSVLMFNIQSSVIFTKRVEHPGYGPQINQNDMDNRLEKLIEKEVEEIIIKILRRGMKS